MESKHILILLLIISGVGFISLFLSLQPEKEDMDVIRIVNQYTFKVQVQLNPLRAEFMKLSNTDEDLTAIIAERDSILSSYGYKPKTKWFKSHPGAGELRFKEELITDHIISAPLQQVYDRIELMRKN